MIFVGLDPAWGTGLSGYCKSARGRIKEWGLLKPEEFPAWVNGLSRPCFVLIDAPLRIPEDRMRKVDLLLRSIYRIGVLPATKKLYPDYLPERIVALLESRGFLEFLPFQAGSRGCYFAESFPTLACRILFGERPPSLSHYREHLAKLLKEAENLPLRPVSTMKHVYDACLLAWLAEEIFCGKFVLVESEDGRIYLPLSQ